MHTFWRLLIAIAFGFVLALLGTALRPNTGCLAPYGPVLLSVAMLPAGLAAAGCTYMLLTRRWGRNSRERARQASLLYEMIRWTTLGLPLVLLLVWVWSYFEFVQLACWDTLHYPREPHVGDVFVMPRFNQGVFTVTYCRLGSDEPDRSAFVDRWGFRYTLSTDHRYAAGPFIESNTYVPIWSLLLLSLPACAVALRREFGLRRIQSRLARGLCGRCGYSLTGNTSGVCPECGERRDAPTGTPGIQAPTHSDGPHRGQMAPRFVE